MTEPVLKIVDRETLDLRLRVSDPEVLAELARRTDPLERETYALAALRLGVLAFKQAAGVLDERAIRNAGQEMVAEMEKRLLDHRRESATAMATELKRYFDQTTGTIPQVLEGLTRRDGTLDRMLRGHVGGDTSTLAATLAQHVGAQSPIFQILSPEQKSGLLAKLNEGVKSALEDQRGKLLGEFDLNRPESALARLVRQMQDGQGSLEKNFKETIGKLASEWSLDTAGSSLVRFKTELKSTIDALAVAQAAFQEKVIRELTEIRTRRETEEKTTRKGAIFEDALGLFLQTESERSRDAYEAVGLRTGAIRHDKRGDFVIELGAESAAPGGRIVVEAKNAAGRNVKDVLAELDGARKNRLAQVGIFVFAAGMAPSGIARFQRHGPDILVVWDPEDPASDIWLKAALEVARALAVRQVRQGSGAAAGLASLDAAISQLEKDGKSLDEIARFAETVVSSGGKIRDEVAVLRKNLERDIRLMREGADSIRDSSAGAS